ncbi:hypothetical protein LTR10_008485 [Elasticomyces elasticus]|nr:hypothetical protein LTR10_008485 [Elasticomyces elasticus]KAK4967357.1 hypothetical protein LTR42_010706 [Elasticomyces elasticus]
MAKKSALLLLPPELRNRIYTLALSSTKPIIISVSTGLPKPSLLKVCRSVTAETTQLYYACNTFELHLAPHTSGIVIQRLRTLDVRTCQAIHSMVLLPDTYDNDSGVGYSFSGLSNLDYDFVEARWRLVCRGILKAGIRAQSLKVDGWKSGRSGGHSQVANKWVTCFKMSMAEALRDEIADAAEEALKMSKKSRQDVEDRSAPSDDMLGSRTGASTLKATMGDHHSCFVVEH